MTTQKSNIMKTVQLCILCSYIISLVFAQQIVPVKKALLASMSDDVVKRQQIENSLICNEPNSGLPIVEDLEVRLRNEAWDINRLRYTLRVQPHGWGESGAARKYNSQLVNCYELKLRLIKDNALLDRYIDILDLMEQSELEECYKELIAVYEDQIKVMEQKKNDVAIFNLNDLIDGEDKNTKANSQLFELQRTNSSTHMRIALSLGDTGFYAFDTTGFVDVDSVIKKIESHSFGVDTNNVCHEYFSKRASLALARYGLERAEKRQYVSYLDFAYDNGEMITESAHKSAGKKYNLDNAYSVEIGIKIPDLTMARSDIARRKADFFSEKENYENRKVELVGKIEKDIQDLRSFIAQYRFLKARESEVDATSSLKKYLQISGIDPLLLLSIKERIVKNHIEISKLKFSILRNYIRVMDFGGELAKPPLRNFLSRNQEPVETP
jgi:hypothetical protein